MTQETIQETVRNRYGAIARSIDEATVQTASCCGPSTDCCGGGAACGMNSVLYDTAMLEGLPIDIAQLSLGCGRTQFT
jgi:hypothetical protein